MRALFLLFIAFLVVTFPVCDGMCGDWREAIVRFPTNDRISKEMLRNFVDAQLRPIEIPVSAAAWAERRDTLRRNLLRVVGIDDLVPPQWDLKLRSCGRIERDGYTIEKITFESYPGLAVSALVYVPQRIDGRVPGVVSLAGHVYGLGKAAEFLQIRNVNLVKRGCVVLAYDYIGCGERNTGPDPMNGRPYGGGNDHGLRSFSFSKRSPTGLEILDAWRAIDVLVARPDVDPERIAFTGESGGGNSTYWISALDERVNLAVPVSSVTSFDYWIRHDRNWDWHQRPPGVRRYADIGTLLALHAPKPLLVISSKRGTDDHEFPLEMAEYSVSWCRTVYRLFDRERALRQVESSTDHGYQLDKRLLLYEAVEANLKPPYPVGRAEQAELSAQVEPHTDLRCGLPEGNRTHLDVFHEWLKPLPRRGEFGNEQEARGFLRDKLGLENRTEPWLRAESIRDDQFEEVAVEHFVLETEEGITLPATLVTPTGVQAAATIILLQRDVKQVTDLVAIGKRVLIIAPRGTAETEEGEEAARRTRNFAWFFGRPLPGMQAFDVIQAARYLKKRHPEAAIELSASGRLAWPALLAAAAVPELFSGGRLHLDFASLRELVNQRGSSSLADVPGLFECLDVTDIGKLWSAGTITTSAGR